MTSRQIEELNAFAQAKLDALEARKTRRVLTPTVRSSSVTADRNGKTLTTFCDNDYLGLSKHPEVIAAAVEAAQTYGAGAGASRLVSGECPLNGQLEAAIARAKGQPACRVFGSGFLANVGVVQALVSKGDIVLMDELSHASMHAGARLSGANVHMFRHNDVDDLESLLRALPSGGRILVMTETVFSMDGDLAPLRELNALCEQYGAWLMTDDAHGFGVVHADNPAPIQMGTLSKAVGVYGGYVCGPEKLMELFISRARSLVYTTGLPPAVLGAALKGVEIIEREGDMLARATIENARRFARALELDEPIGAIVPVIVGKETVALDLQSGLFADGFHVSAIRPPTVPEGTARLRFSFSAEHSSQDVDAVSQSLKRHMKEKNISLGHLAQ